MSLLAEIVVGGFGLVLIAFAGLAFVRPAPAERFLRLFASSARAHYTEQAFRLLIGVAIVVLAPSTWHTTLFQAIGGMIAGTALVLILLPWRWHWRFGNRVMPTVLRYLKLYAVGMCALGILLLSGVFAKA